MLPATNEHSQLLFEEYLTTRKVKLSKEEFFYIILLYPSLLVCMCDGKLDQKEWEGVTMLAKSLADEFSDVNLGEQDKEQLTQALRTEFRYLLDNVDKWSKKFLNTLKNHLEMNPGEREFILETMYLFANTDEGISDIEQKTIDDLTKRLALNH